MGPIIFLDIDGVLNTRRAAGWSPEGRRIVRTPGLLPHRSLCPRAMRNLNRLCESSGAQVVVSSSWRVDRDVRKILPAAGFTGSFHPDWCTDVDGPLRSDEIARWLAAHDRPPFVVIDDYLSELAAMHERLVLTEAYAGLTAADVELALNILAEVPDGAL